MNLAKLFDHTLLRPTATPSEIERLCSEAREHGVFSVCISPYHVARAFKLLHGSDVKVCTVVGFPHGTHLSHAKAEEARELVALGAQEIDMVVSVPAIASGDDGFVARDIASVVQASGTALVKVILETCYLTPQQIATYGQIAVDAGAHFLKTSTGYGTRGASLDDIKILASVAAKSSRKIGVKASGGIKTLAQVEELVAAGATRIGASGTVEILAGTASTRAY